MTIALLGILCSINQPELLSVYKHCFTGWFVIFAIGICMGKQRDNLVNTNHSVVMDIVVLFLMVILVVTMNKWMVTWLFVPIVALAMFIAAGLIVIRSRPFFLFFRWIGGLSASIFVLHPIVRFVVNKYMLPRVDSLIVIVITYVIATLMIAIIYNNMYRKLLIKFSSK